MSPSIAPLLAAAESLSVAERYELIDLLLVGLNDVSPTESDEAPPALTEAWRQEIARRSAEYDAGRAETVSWQEVRARWQQRVLETAGKWQGEFERPEQGEYEQRESLS